ncbi:hypothetical protein B0T19DRAFT_138436 [Cercophora scortea]|uniref:Uncharacterized protein n=1 Tax=Cercophora scortea TaxID=314031 RepID=A0AAE0IYT4_9PEZI|nr:hypothetical protein B0T19DRAFT_138436 [Cercophora scortea]
MTIRDRLHRIITRKSASTSSSSSAGGGDPSTPVPGNPPSTTIATTTTSDARHEPMSPAAKLLSKPLTWRPGHGGRLRPRFKNNTKPQPPRPDEDLSPAWLEQLSREEAPNETTLERYHHQAKLERYRLRFGGGDVAGRRRSGGYYEDNISPCSSRPASLHASGGLLPSSSAAGEEDGCDNDDDDDDDNGSNRGRRRSRKRRSLLGTGQRRSPGTVGERGEGG